MADTTILDPEPAPAAEGSFRINQASIFIEIPRVDANGAVMGEPERVELSADGIFWRGQRFNLPGPIATKAMDLVKSLLQLAGRVA